MLMFLGYWLPIILLIGGLYIFKKLFVKCTKNDDYYNKKTIQEPITFPIWQYTLYLLFTFIPIANWVSLIALIVTLVTEDYSSYCCYSGRDYWYEIPNETIEKTTNYINKILDKLFNSLWFVILCAPFVYLYKIMTKKV